MCLFGPKNDETVRGLHNEELHNLYSSPIKLIAGYVTRMGAMRECIQVFYGNVIRIKTTRGNQDQDLGWRVTLKLILEREDMVWTGFTWLRIATGRGILRTR
jgi:hypothetical protein